MKASDIAKLRKEDIVWLAGHTCKHGHKYLSHYQCYLKERGDPEERVGYLDIETTDLAANFGIMISWAILDKTTGRISGRTVTRKEMLEGIYDRDLTKELIKAMGRFDRLVVYYGKNGRFDIPFIRARALKHRIDFPKYGDAYVTDVYDWVKSKLRLHRNRLQAACDFIGIPSKGHPLTGDRWFKAKMGDEECLKYVWKHNVEDVKCLATLHQRLEPFQRKARVSI